MQIHMDMLFTMHTGRINYSRRVRAELIYYVIIGIWRSPISDVWTIRVERKKSVERMAKN